MQAFFIAIVLVDLMEQLKLFEEIIKKTTFELTKYNNLFIKWMAGNKNSDTKSVPNPEYNFKAFDSVKNQIRELFARLFCFIYQFLFPKTRNSFSLIRFFIFYKNWNGEKLLFLYLRISIRDAPETIQDNRSIWCEAEIFIQREKLN